MSRQYAYSKDNPLVLVLETPGRQADDELANERKIRRNLQRQLMQREDEIEQLREENRITQEEYRSRLQDLYAQQETSEKLIAKMVEYYSRIDYDHLDDYNRQISTYILNGELKGCLIDNIGDRRAEAYRKCADLSKQRIYKSKPVLDVELSGFRIMATLMEAMVDAAVNPERFYSRQLISRVSSQYDIDSPDLETRLMAVIDYISGMTDVYALDIYQKINGISLPIV